MSTILIAGGTGLIGQRLSEIFIEKGYEVILLSRKGNLSAAPKKYKWDIPNHFIEEEAIQKADYVINLAGAGIADSRWTDQRKKEVIDSRLDSTRLLLEAFKKINKKPKMYIAASAIGFYGETKEEWIDENAKSGEGFLSKVCVLWEKATKDFEEWNVPTAIIRVGIVFSTKGGALQKMLPSYNFRLGTYFASGIQYYSWIHIEDICQIFVAVLENKWTGIFNGVAPKPTANKQLAKDIATALDKNSLIISVPKFALRLAMGEMADVVLVGSRVSSKKLENLGFQFQFPKLIPAVRDIVARKV